MPPFLDRLFRVISRYIKRVFKKREDRDVLHAIRTIEQVSVFNHMNWRNRRDLAHVLHYRTYRPEEYIYYEGDPGLGLYIVEKGRVNLWTGSRDDRQQVRTVEPYECFGTYSLLGEYSRLVTAQAQTETRLLGLFRPDLQTLSNRHPRTGMLVLTGLARYLVASQIELINSASAHMPRADILRLLYEITPESITYHDSPLI